LLESVVDIGTCSMRIASFELASTSAGSLVLQGGGKGHHADRAIATALAHLSATHLDTYQGGEYRLHGWA
jgi:hypothetical protein